MDPVDLFEQNKTLFDLKLKVDFPDHNVLFVYTKKNCKYFSWSVW